MQHNHERHNNDSQGEATVNKIDKAPHDNSFASHLHHNSSVANIPQNLGPMSITSIQKPSEAELLDEKKSQSIFNNMLINKMSAYDFKQAMQVGESTNSLLPNKALVEKNKQAEYSKFFGSTNLFASPTRVPPVP